MAPRPPRRPPYRHARYLLRAICLQDASISIIRWLASCYTSRVYAKPREFARQITWTRVALNLLRIIKTKYEPLPFEFPEV